MPVHSARTVATGPTDIWDHADQVSKTALSTLRTEITEFGAGSVSLRVRGDIDVTNLARLRTLLGHLLTRGIDLLVLDVSEVSFLSARGLAVLLEARDAAVRSGVDLRLVSGNRAVSRPLEATGFASFFPNSDGRSGPFPRQRDGG